MREFPACKSIWNLCIGIDFKIPTLEGNEHDEFAKDRYLLKR